MPFLQPLSEIIAAITGLLGVWLTSRQHIACWPVALVSIVFSLFVFYSERLYQDAILQVFYLLMTFYGWYNWRYGGKNDSPLQVTRMSRYTLTSYLMAGAVAALASGYWFSEHSDAVLPYWDALSLIGGIIGTVWMARKWIEHWLLWVVIDILCTGIYFSRSLYFFTIQYFIFTLLAIYGWYCWKKELSPPPTLPVK